MSTVTPNGNGDADQFYDAVSTTSELTGSESVADLETIAASRTTNTSNAATVSMKRTVLSYSDRNGLQINTQQLNITGQQIQQRPLDPYDDFALSNKLNSITLSNSLELHHYVFHNDLDAIRSYIKRYEDRAPDQLSDYLSIRDVHGNTPLHLAAMLGHLEAAKLLTQSGAVVKARNKQLWTPLNEAISYGERDLIRPLLVKFEREVDLIIADSKPKIISALEDMLDFYVEIKWDFESWIPLVSRFLPSDVCKLYKSGRRLRLDCTLGDLAAKSASGSRSGESANGSGSSASPFSWQRGDLTFLFDVEKVGDKNSIVFMDNKKRTFCYVDKKDEGSVDGVDLMDEMDIEKEIDMLLGREMIHIKLDTKQASFLPTQTGWFSKRDKIEEINGYQCQFYDVSNLYIVSKLRNEHLSEEEIKKREEKQKKMKEKMNSHHHKHSHAKKPTKPKQQQTNNNGADAESLSNKSSNNVADLEEVNLEEADGDEAGENEADYDDDDFDDFMIEHRPSLPPPPKTMATWSEYITAEEAKWPTLGRKMRCKESKKEFKAQLAMSQEFPLTINDLNNLLEALAPLAKFRKLKEFINVKLPPGFPVKIDIPIVHTVTAKVSFQNFKKNYKSDPLLFRIPPNYTEENIQDLLTKDNKPKDSTSITNTSTTATATTATATETATTTDTMNESSPTHF